MEERIILNDEEILTVADSDTFVETEIVETANEGETSLKISPLEKNESTEKLKLVRLPLARVKHIIKMDPESNLISSDSVFAVTKATELFLQLLIKQALRFTESSKKKTIMKRDLEAAIDSLSNLCFLDGTLD